MLIFASICWLLTPNKTFLSATSIGCIENQVQQINVADKNVLFGVKSQQMLAKMSIFGAPNMRW
jgi:hypothetical protein